MEYREFLQSCDFIKVLFRQCSLSLSLYIYIYIYVRVCVCVCVYIFLAVYLLLLKLYLCITFLLQADSQWRKLQDRLEADERCARLEKIERLDIFLVILYL